MNAGLVNVEDGSWSKIRQNFARIKGIVGPNAIPTLTGLTLTGLTASRLMASDANKALSSVADLTSWIAGVANEINITDDGDGTVTIGIVDPLIVAKGGIGAASLTDHGLLVGSGTDAITALGVAANGQIPIGSAGADPVLANITGTAKRVTVTNGTGTITLSGPQDLDTVDSPTFAGLTIVNTINEFSTDGTMGGDSDNAVPTEKAAKAYTDALRSDLASTANAKGASLVGIEDSLSLYTAVNVEAALAEVKDAITVVTTTASSITTITGTLDSGNVASTQTINDADTYDVSEASGTPGFDIQATMTGIVSGHEPNLIEGHYSYDGNHTVRIEMWNYTGTPAWDLISDTIIVNTGGALSFFSLAITGTTTDYVSGGESKVRFNHAVAGNMNHDFAIDYLAIKDDHGIGTGITDHGSLSGLSEDDHQQYIKDAEFTQDSGILVGTGAGTFAEETGATLRTSIGVGTGDSPQFTGIELGHASDTTITRVSAGVVAIEGTNIAMVGGAHHDGFSDFVGNEHIDHTGVTLTAGTGLTGGGDISAGRTFAVDGILEDLDTLGASASDGQFIVATGTGAFAYEATTTARTSLGVGEADVPFFGGIQLRTTGLTKAVYSSSGAVGVGRSLFQMFRGDADGSNANGWDFGYNLDLSSENFIIRELTYNGGLVANTRLTLAKGSGNMTLAGTLTVSSIAAEGSDVDKFLVDSSGLIKYRTGANVLSDIGAAASGHNHSGVYEPADAGLTSLAGLSYVAASFIKMTGVNTFALRTIGETADDLEGTIDHNNLANTHNLTTDISHDSISDVSVDDHHAESHTHDGDTLQLDAVNSNGGAFAFNTTEAVTFNQTVNATFAGNITGNVTGNTSGSSGSCTGLSATATALATARNIGGVSFDGTAAITPTTIVVADTTDTSCYVGLWESATGSLLPKTDAAVTYNAGTGALTATTFIGALTGQADTVATITGLAPDTATTQATQAGITTCANLTTVGTIASGTWQGTTIAVNQGGTGQTTAQAAIDALSAVSGATNEHVLTKDTGSGNAIWKVAAGGGTDEKVKIDAAATAGYIGAASNDGVLRTGTGLSYTDGGDFVTLDLDINALTVDATPVGSTDYVATYDNTASTEKKVLLDTFHRFVNRGDPAAADYAIGDLTADTLWYDLNLNGVGGIPGTATAIVLHIQINDNTVGKSIKFRKNGNSNNTNISRVRVQETNVTNYADLIVPCDSSQIIEYAVDAAITACNIIIKGWFLS